MTSTPLPPSRTCWRSWSRMLRSLARPRNAGKRWLGIATERKGPGGRPVTALVRRRGKRTSVTAVTPPPDPSTSTDRVAIVTGGSRCLGREVACDLARRGYAVVVDYAHDQAEADRLVDELLGCGGVATAVRGDVND